MKKRRWMRITVAVLVFLTVAVLFGTLYYHGEVWFPALQSARLFHEVMLEEADPDVPVTRWSVAQLAARDDVVFSNHLMLISEEYPIPDRFEPLLTEYNGARMHPMMVSPYIGLRDRVQEMTGVRIYVASDFRTPEEQESILNSEQEGVAAQAGCSEHEAGLALDVYAPYYGGINFLRSPAGRTVNRICDQYGFIIRYPNGKSDVTGIDYEPWHLRYVGSPHAEVISEYAITLEEYINMLTPNVWYCVGSYRVARLSGDALDLPNGWTSCVISPDNTGYLIVTLTMES